MWWNKRSVSTMQNPQQGTYSHQQMADSVDYSRAPVHIAERNVEVAIIIPALQAIYLGLSTGMVLGIGAGLLTKSIKVGFIVCILSFLIIQTIIGVVFVLDWRRRIMRLEDLLHRDINKDGVQGKAFDIKVWHTDEKENRTWMSRLTLPGTPEQLYEFLTKGALNDATTDARWTVGSKKTYTKEDFSELRSLLIDKGYAEWLNDRNHLSGWRFTPIGKAFAREWVSNYLENRTSG